MELLIIILVAVLAISFSLYNGIVGAHNGAQRAWADVLTYERGKTKILDAIGESASAFKAHEQYLLEKTTQLRSAVARLPQAADGSSLVDVQTATKELRSALTVTIEAYPDLKSSDLIKGQLREISEQQENVAAAIAIFNRKVELFNNSIQMLPGSLINDFLNKKSPILAFKDEAASSNFDYRPNF